MLKLIGSRLVLAVPQLLIVSLLVFLLTYMVPGSTAVMILGDARATPDEVARVNHELGLDRPIYEQLLSWLTAAMHGDLGQSLATHREVTDLLALRLPATLSLVGGGLFVAIVLGVSLGVFAGVNSRRLADRATTAFASVMQSIPAFWLGLILVLVFVIQLRWAPVVGWTPITENPARWLKGMILPSLALGASGSALIARQTRTAVAEALASRYADTLAAAGVPRRLIIWRYALKNAMMPVLASSGLLVAVIFSTSLVLERVFAIQGVGWLLLTNVLSKDFPVVQGAALILCLIIIVVNIVLDICYGLINPKARPQ